MKKTTLLITIILILSPIIQVKAEGELIKSENYKAVYYKASDGQRYIFPNQKIYNSWYSDFSGITILSDKELAEIPLGGNVFYKPNSRLIKIKTDPKVYWVDEFGILRHIVSEKTAQDLFGSDWFNKIDDLPEEYFLGYKIGDPIDSDFSISIFEDWKINDNKLLTTRSLDLQEEEKQEQNGSTQEHGANETVEEPEIVDAEYQPESINLTATSDGFEANLTWFVNGGNTNYGFIILKSKINILPTYDLEENYVENEDYIILHDDKAKAYDWKNLDYGSAYYFRICRLNSDDSCGVYSNVESLTFGSTDKVSKIILTGVVDNNTAKLSWEKEWVNANYGFILVKDINENPEYPFDNFLRLSGKVKNYNWEGLSNGIYHFRICRYKGVDNGDRCEYYSNNLELNIE